MLSFRGETSSHKALREGNNAILHHPIACCAQAPDWPISCWRTVCAQIKPFRKIILPHQDSVSSEKEVGEEKKSIKFSSNSAACRDEMYFPSVDQREKASLHLCEIPGVRYRLARCLKIINTLSLVRASITSPQTANLDIGISLVGRLQCHAIKQRRIIGFGKGEREATLINGREKKTWTQGSRQELLLLCQVTSFIWGGAGEASLKSSLWGLAAPIGKETNCKQSRFLFFFAHLLRAIWSQGPWILVCWSYQMAEWPVKRMAGDIDIDAI